MEREAEFLRLTSLSAINESNQHLWYAFFDAADEARALKGSYGLPRQVKTYDPSWARNLDRQTPEQAAEWFGWNLLNEVANSEKSDLVVAWATAYINREYASAAYEPQRWMRKRVEEFELPVSADVKKLIAMSYEPD